MSGNKVTFNPLEKLFKGTYTPIENYFTATPKHLANDKMAAKRRFSEYPPLPFNAYTTTGSTHSASYGYNPENK